MLQKLRMKDGKRRIKEERRWEKETRRGETDDNNNGKRNDDGGGNGTNNKGLVVGRRPVQWLGGMNARGAAGSQSTLPTRP